MALLKIRKMGRQGDQAGRMHKDMHYNRTVSPQPSDLRLLLPKLDEIDP
jgi:hypothetical protein